MRTTYICTDTSRQALWNKSRPPLVPCKTPAVFRLSTAAEKHAEARWRCHEKQSVLAHLHGEAAGEGIVRFKLPVKHARPLCHPAERRQVVVILCLSQQLLLPLKEKANRKFMAPDSHCSWVHSNACCSRQFIAGLLFPASLPCCSKDQEEASSTHATLEASAFPS